VVTELGADYLYYRRSPDRPDTEAIDPGATGGMNRIFIDVAENKPGRAPVRFAESVSTGVGEVWRATVWMALFAAASVVERDPLELRITVEAEGVVDGPSAGALMAAMITAGVRRVPLSPDATLTGTLNPDLTIGPVGGVPEKVLAAIAGGKKRIGIPVGQARAISLKTGRQVDLMALGKEKGVEIVELEDVHDAYRLLTGEALPPGPSLTEAEMILPLYATRLLNERARTVISRVVSAEASFRQLAESLSAVDTLPREIADLVRFAQESLDAGRHASALFSALEAHRGFLDHQTRVLSRLGATHGEWATVREILRKLRTEVEGGIVATMPRWKSETPWAATEVPLVTDSFDGLIQALRGLAMGDKAATQRPVLERLLLDRSFVPAAKDVQLLLEGVSEYASNLAVADSRLLSASVYLDLLAAGRVHTGVTTGSPMPTDVLDDVAAQYGRVADANLGYVEALLVLPAAEGLKEVVEEIRRRIASTDEDFRQAYLGRVLPTLLSESLVGGRERSYAMLSGAVSSFLASAAVISKRYSLNAEIVGDEGRVVAIRHKAAFESMLRLAERGAREAAAACLAELGELPITTLLEYRLGRELDDFGRRRHEKDPATGVSARLQGLNHLWRAYTHARLALATHRRLLRQSTLAAPKAQSGRTPEGAASPSQSSASPGTGLLGTGSSVAGRSVAGRSVAGSSKNGKRIPR